MTCVAKSIFLPSLLYFDKGLLLTNNAGTTTVDRIVHGVNKDDHVLSAVKKSLLVLLYDFFYFILLCIEHNQH